MKCPKCNNNDMIIKKINNQFVISCKGYPLCKYSIWCGAVTKSVTMTNEKCNRCTCINIYIYLVSQGRDVFLLKFVFDKNHLPINIFETEFKCCVGEYNNALDEIGIRITSFIPPPNQINNNNSFDDGINDSDLIDLDLDESELINNISSFQPPPQPPSRSTIQQSKNTSLPLNRSSSQSNQSYQSSYSPNNQSTSYIQQSIQSSFQSNQSSILKSIQTPQKIELKKEYPPPYTPSLTIEESQIEYTTSDFLSKKDISNIELIDDDDFVFSSKQNIDNLCNDIKKINDKISYNEKEVFLNIFRKCIMN